MADATTSRNGKGRDDAADRQRRKRKRDAAGLPVPRCNVVTRAGTRCKLPAGHAVPGVSTGPCARHGGRLPRVHAAAVRSELLAEAKRWADDHDADPGDLMLGLVRATAAHAALVERRLHELAGDEPDVLAWHRALDAVQRTAADVAARAVSLGLEERRQRLTERQADLLAAAITDGLCEAFGDLATVERRSVFSDVVTRRLLVLEGTAEELDRLRDPTPTLTGATT
jgi:hypothetical protein